MAKKQKFGGPWTIEKLGILSEYLDFYATALKNQQFDIIYIDAFAGTGKIQIGEGEDYITIDGSAKLALRAKQKFDRYYFIEKKKAFSDELQNLVETQYQNLSERVTVKNGDCNKALIEICDEVDWARTRAVLFLDPFAGAVKWDTLRTVSETKAIDVWYLFPFNAVTRLMKKRGSIDPTWKAKLNDIFGDDSWEEEFYKEDPQISLFDDHPMKREMDQQSLKQYIERRLETIFEKVSHNSRILYNTKNSPLFMFCFAMSNGSPKAQGLGLKGANYILKKEVR